VRSVSLLRVLLIASCTTFPASLPGAADLLGQPPRQDERKIASASGVARTETGDARAPAAHRVPRHQAAASSGWNPAREASDSRGAASWTLFSILVVLLGALTIRMVRGFGGRALFERLDVDDMERQIPG
jgi:hypothetical protein